MGAQGSPAQVGAAPSIATTPLAGGALAVGTTEDGPRLVAALSLNPASALAGETEDLATTSRLADLSIVVPVDTSGDEGASAVDYVGVRARLNLLAFSQGPAALELAVRDLRESLDAYSDRIHDQLLVDLRNALRSASDRSACAAAIRNCETDEEVAKVCGGQTVGSSWRASRDATEVARERVRRELDGNTLGLDLRMDFGDPTFSGTRDLGDAFSMLGAGALSWRFVRGQRTTMTLRARLGMVYRRSEATASEVVDPDADDDVDEFAVDWGGSLAATFATGQGQTEVSLGLEGRERTSDEGGVELTPLFEDGMDFVDLRIGVSVPVSESAALGVGIALPLDDTDQRSPTLTVTGDWSVLLSALGAS
jgi:hypothetical protein